MRGLTALRHRRPSQLPGFNTATSSLALASGALMLLSFLLASEAAFAVAILVLVVNYRGARTRPAIDLVFASVLMIALIAAMGAARGFAPRDMVRDVYYFSILPVFLLAGMWIGRQGADPRMIGLLQVWCVVQVCFLAYLSVQPEAEGLTRQQYRAYIGYSVPGAVFAVPLAIWQYRCGQMVRPTIVIIFASLAVYITDSRTQLVMSLAAAAIAIFRPRSWLVRSALLVTGLFTVCFGTPVYETLLGASASQSFRDAGPEAIVEWMPYPYIEESLVNSRWRAFEGYRAYQQWLGAPLSQQLLGQGAGSQVDLGRLMKLGPDIYRSVPTLHNGWMYVLTKSGILGVLYVFFVLIRAGLRPLAGIPRRSPEAALVAVSVFCVLLSFPTSTGFLNHAATGTPVIFFWGLALGWAAATREAAARKARSGMIDARSELPSRREE